MGLCRKVDDIRVTTLEVVDVGGTALELADIGGTTLEVGPAVGDIGERVEHKARYRTAEQEVGSWSAVWRSGQASAGTAN